MDARHWLAKVSSEICFVGMLAGEKRILSPTGGCWVLASEGDENENPSALQRKRQSFSSMAQPTCCGHNGQESMVVACAILMLATSLRDLNRYGSRESLMKTNLHLSKQLGSPDY